jgi:hypothetical protein
VRPDLVSVFAVEDTALQVVWRTLPAPDVCIEVGDQQVAAAATPPAFLALMAAHRAPWRHGATRSGGQVPSRSTASSLRRPTTS